MLKKNKMYRKQRSKSLYYPIPYEYYDTPYQNENAMSRRYLERKSQKSLSNPYQNENARSSWYLERKSQKSLSNPEQRKSMYDRPLRASVREQWENIYVPTNIRRPKSRRRKSMKFGLPTFTNIEERKLHEIVDKIHDYYKENGYDPMLKPYYDQASDIFFHQGDNLAQQNFIRKQGELRNIRTEMEKQIPIVQESRMNKKRDDIKKLLSDIRWHDQGVFTEMELMKFEDRSKNALREKYLIELEKEINDSLARKKRSQGGLLSWFRGGR
jgi:hypothetical protein